MAKKVEQIQELEVPSVVSRPQACRVWENHFTLKVLVIVLAIIIVRDSAMLFYLLMH